MSKKTSIVIVFFLVNLVPVFLYGQEYNSQLAKRVDDLAAAKDYQQIQRIMAAEEDRWRTEPSFAYFNNMFAIAEALNSEQVNETTYGMSRKAIWGIIAKPPPLEDNGIQSYYILQFEMLTDFIWSIPVKKLAAVRHDNFLMLSMLARRARSAIIDNYEYKPSGIIGDEAMNLKLMPKRIKRQIQSGSERLLQNLKDESKYYLPDAYGHAPRDDAEMIQLMNDIGFDEDSRTAVWAAIHSLWHDPANK